MLVDPNATKIKVTDKNLRAIKSKFEKVAGRALFRRFPSVQEFAAKVSLPQTVKTYSALLSNLRRHPEQVYFLNQRCVHCINLYTQDPAVNSTNVRWLNTGDQNVPEDVLHLFDFEAPCTTTEFYRRVPFPHKLESKIEE